MAKNLIAAALSGSIVAGDNTITITDPAAGLTIKADGIRAGDALNLLRENYGDEGISDGWEPATDGRGHIQININRRTATPVEVGVYTVEGYVDGSVVLWTEAI